MTEVKLQLVYNVKATETPTVCKRLGYYGIPYWSKKTENNSTLVVVPVGDNKFNDFQVMIERLVRG